jgi:hypothetical protein
MSHNVERKFLTENERILRNDFMKGGQFGEILEYNDIICIDWKATLMSGEILPFVNMVRATMKKNTSTIASTVNDLTTALGHCLQSQPSR